MSKFCGVCDKNIGDATWESHNKEWSHMKSIQQKEHTVVLEMDNGWRNITQTDIIYMFSKFGPIVKINMHAKVLPALGYAYVEFSKPEIVTKVLSQCFYKIKGFLVKASRWISEKQREASMELELKEIKLNHEKEKKYIHDMFSSMKLGSTTEDQIKQLSLMFDMPSGDQKASEDLRSDIESIIKVYIPEARVNLIGSYANGLGVRGSDVNLEVEFSPDARRPEAKYLPKAPPLPSAFLKQTEFRVEAGRVTYSSLKANAKVIEALWFVYEILNKSPLSLNLAKMKFCEGQESYGRRNKIFFRYLRHQANCEVQVKMGRSINIYIARLIRTLTKLDERVRALYIAVRFWAKQVGVFETFGSYGIFLLVYCYLQTTKPPMLPSVETLSKMCPDHQKQFIRSTEVTICTDIDKIQQQCLTPKNTQSVPELLQGFFKYFSKSEMTNRVFCPRSGRSYNMLKFRNMKKVIRNIETFNLHDRCFYIQDLFRPYYNVVSPCPYINKHHVSLEFLRAATIVRDSFDKSWHLLSVFPMKPIKSHMDSILQKAPVVIPFDPSVLPEGFLAYSSYTEAENQWYQWVVELTMKILQILRITYNLEGDFGAENVDGKRPLLDGLDNNKRLKSDVDSLLHAADRDAAMNFESCFEPERTVVQETRLRCVDGILLWKKRSKQTKHNWSTARDLFELEETITQRNLEDVVPGGIVPQEFILVMQHVKTNNESQIEMGAESVGASYDSYGLLSFMNFFQDFVMRLICKEVGLDVTLLVAKFKSS